LSNKNNSLKSNNTKLKENYAMVTDDDDRHHYIVVLRKNNGKNNYEDSEINDSRLTIPIDKRFNYPEWIDELYKHYIIRVQKRNLNKHVNDLRGTLENPGPYPNLEVILNFEDSNSISLVNVLRNELFVKKSYYNHFCVLDEKKLLTFIVTYKQEL